MAYLGAGITRFNTADGLTVKGTAEFTDTVVLGDSDELRFGESADLKIYHDGNKSVIEDAGTGQLLLRTSKLDVKNPDSSAAMLSATAAGAVVLKHDNVTRIETTSSGATITGDLTTSGGATVAGSTTIDAGGNAGSSVDTLFLNSSVSGTSGSGSKLYLQGGTGGNSRAAIIEGVNTTGGGNGHSLRFYTNESTQNPANRMTISHGGDVTVESGNLNLGDDQEVRLGDSADFKLFHKSSTNQSIINEGGAGSMLIQASNMFLQNNSGGGTYAKFTDGGAAEFYYDNTKRLETTSTGATVTGDIKALDVVVEGVSPTVILTDTNAAADNQKIQIALSSSGELFFQYLNDNGGGGGSYISMPRTGNSLDSFDMYRAGVLKNRFTTISGDNYITSGNVGIGTTSIEDFGGGHSTLEVAGTTTSEGGVFKTATSDSAGTGASGTEMIMFTDSTNGGSINVVSSDALRLMTANTARMTIDSSGNVGIGASPAAKLHVQTSAVNSSIDNVADEFVIENNGASGMTILSANNDSGFILFGDPDYNAPAGIRYEHANDAFSFRTNSSWDRMRITSSGEALIGTSSAGSSSRLHVKGGATLCVMQNDSANGGTYQETILFRNSSGSGVGSITTNSTSVAYNTTSDHRLKENVADMTGAIDRVKALAPKRFNFNADADTTVDGFLAHEAQAVVPEAVTGEHNEVDDDGNAVMQGIDQSKLVPLLTGALKEAITKIETLETEVAALKAAN